MEQPLAACRAEIDRIDHELLKLLAQRFSVVDKVIAIKTFHGLPAAIPDRIEAVVQRATELAPGVGVPAEAAENLWRKLVDVTIAYERKRRVIG